MERVDTVVEKAFALCRERKEVPIAEIAKMAHDAGVRASEVLRELAITEGLAIDYIEGIVRCDQTGPAMTPEDIDELRGAVRELRQELKALSEEVARIRQLLNEQRTPQNGKTRET